MNQQYALAIKSLSFSYEKKPVLTDISLNVNIGEIVSIIGPNGCGKSTLLKLSDQLIKTNETQNSINIYGKPLCEYTRKELSTYISFLPQNRNIPQITVRRLVEHGRFPYLDFSRKLSNTDTEAINEAIHTMQLDTLQYKDLSTLSGGERQRAYIALCLAQDTPLMFMDEPTTYLDINHKHELLRMIKQLNECKSKTILMVLHDISLALKYSHHIAVIHNGQIKMFGTPKEVVSSGVLTEIFNIKCIPVTIDNVLEYLIC